MGAGGGGKWESPPLAKTSILKGIALPLRALCAPALQKRTRTENWLLWGGTPQPGSVLSSREWVGRGSAWPRGDPWRRPQSGCAWWRRTGSYQGKQETACKKEKRKKPRRRGAGTPESGMGKRLCDGAGMGAWEGGREPHREAQRKPPRARLGLPAFPDPGRLLLDREALLPYLPRLGWNVRVWGGGRKITPPHWTWGILGVEIQPFQKLPTLV